MIPRMAAEERFTVSYDGPALEGHQMDVRDLAVALVGFADALTNAHRVLELDGPPPRLNIAATQEGSFEVHLALQEASLLGAVMTMLASTPPTAAANLAQLVQATFNGIGLVRRLGGRLVGHNSRNVGERIEVKLPDGTSVTVARAVAAVADDPQFRREVRRAAAPLERPGVDELLLTSERSEVPAVRLVEADLKAFDPVDPTLPEPQTTTMVLKPRAVTFVEGNKHRWNDGAGEFNAAIADEVFTARMASGEVRLAPLDELHCQVTTTYTRQPNGQVKTERVIDRVLRYLPMWPGTSPLQYES